MSQSKKSKEIRPAETLELDPKSEDELIHVPKGSSRARFYFVLALTIFVLLVFVVAEPLMSTAGGGSDADKAFMRWEGPGGEERSLSRADFMSEKLRFGYLDDVIVRGLGLAPKRIQDDEEAARLVLMDDLAQGWGIEITDRELADQLRQFFGPDLVGYDQYVGRFRTLSKSGFEAVLRRAMRITRFESLLAAGVAVADPETLVERWQESHKEFAFDYVELLSSTFTDEARANLPGDAELEAWLMTQSEVERSRLMAPDTYTAEAAYVPFGGEAAAALLLERFPRPEGEDAAELARDYYNRFTHVRFQRPEPLPEPEEPETPADPEAETPEDATQAAADDALAERDRIYFTFDEVQAQAQAEAPVYYAMVDWLADLSKRAAEGPIDLAREAGELGLEFERIDTPYTRQQWTDEVERPWLGRFVVGSHQNVQPGQLVPRVVVEEDAIVVSRVVERFPRALPPFPQIRDDVAESWAKAEATRLALAKMQTFYDRLVQESPTTEESTPAAVVVGDERFAELAAEAAFEVKRRDFRERFTTEPPVEGTEELEAYLRISSGAYSGEDGAVTAPAANRAGSHVFLLRLAARQNPAESKMKPDDVSGLRSQIQQQRMNSFFLETFRSPEFLAERYGLWLRPLDEQ